MYSQFLKTPLSTLGMIAVSITLGLKLGNSDCLVLCLLLNPVRPLVMIRIQLYYLLKCDFSHFLILDCAFRQE